MLKISFSFARDTSLFRKYIVSIIPFPYKISNKSSTRAIRVTLRALVFRPSPANLSGSTSINLKTRGHIVVRLSFFIEKEQSFCSCSRHPRVQSSLKSSKTCPSFKVGNGN